MRLLIPLILMMGMMGCTSTSSLTQGPYASGAAAAGRAGLQAKRAAVIGDWAVVVKLMEKAYGEDPSLANEFNLATAYARNHQPSLAITMFEDVARKGDFDSAVPIRQRNDTLRTPRASFDYSDEALRRIALLTGQVYPESP